AGCRPAMASSRNAVAVVVISWSVPRGLSASHPMYSTAATGRNRASTRWRVRAALSIDLSSLLVADRLGDSHNARSPAPSGHLAAGHTFRRAYAFRHRPASGPGSLRTRPA